MSRDNPYQNTNVQSAASSRTARRKYALRFWLYGHVAALCVTALFSLADRGGISISTGQYAILEWMILPAFAALFICPVAILVCILRSTASANSKLVIVGLEAVIFAAHVLALLPAVQ